MRFPVLTSIFMVKRFKIKCPFFYIKLLQNIHLRYRNHHHDNPHLRHCYVLYYKSPSQIIETTAKNGVVPDATSNEQPI